MKQKILCKSLSIISACALLLSTFGIFGSIFAVSVNKADQLNLQKILEDSNFLVDNTTEKKNLNTALEKLTLPDGYSIGEVEDFYKIKAITGAYEIGSANGGSSYKGAPSEDTVLVEGIDGYISASVPVSLNGEPLGKTVLSIKIEAPMKSYSFKSCTNNINDWVGNNAEGWKLLQTAVAEKIVVPDEISNLQMNWLNWNSTPICVVYGKGINTIPRTDSLSSAEVVSFKGNVEALNGLAFYNWKSLKYIRLPETVKTISSMAFKHCYSMENLYLPNGLETIGVELFYSPREDNINHDPEGSDNLIGKLNYEKAYKISEITIPATVKDIYAEAFVGAGVDCSFTVLTHSDNLATNTFYHKDMDDSMGKHIYLRSFADDVIYKSAYSLNNKVKLDDAFTIAEVAARVARQASIEGDTVYNDIDSVKKAASKMLLNMKYSYGEFAKYTLAWGGEWVEDGDFCKNTVVINDGETLATIKVEIPLDTNSSSAGTLKISNSTTAASLKKDLEAKYQGSSVEVTDFYLIESMPMVYEVGSVYAGAVDGEILVPGKNGYVSACYTVTDSQKNKTSHTLLEVIEPEKIEKSYASVSNDISHWSGNNGSGYSFNVAYKAQKVVIPDEITKLASDYLNYENAIECLVVGKGVTTLPRSPFQTKIDTVSFKSNDSLKTIGLYAFHTWSSLRYIQLPDSVEKISEQAFRKCVSLEYFYIPSGIKTIQSHLFYVPSEDNKADGTLDYSKGYNIRSITIPSTIESIYDYAFVGAASDCEITFLTKSDSWSWFMCYNNSMDKSLGEHIFIRGFAEDASYKWNHSVNEKVNLTKNMTVAEAAARAALANEGIGGGTCDSVAGAKELEDEIKTQLQNSFGAIPSIDIKWKESKWIADGYIISNSLVLTKDEKSFELPVKLFLEAEYELQEIVLENNIKASNTTNSVGLLEQLKKIVLPGGFKATRIIDFYKLDAIEGAIEIGSTYKGAVDGEILVPGEKGYIAAIVLSETTKGTSRKDAILLEIEPTMAEYSFETVSTEKDFTYNSQGWGQRWEYHPMSGKCAEKLVIPDKITELKKDWHQNYIYTDFSSTVRCVVYNENITSIPGIYNFSALQVVSIKGDVETLDTYVGNNLLNGSFEDCRSLRHIRLPDTLKHIGAQAFIGCVSLKNLYLPEGLETIGKEAFWAKDDWNDYYINNFTIPSTVKTIGEKAFVGANLSTNITVLTNAPADDKNGIHSNAFYSEERLSASNKNTIRVIEGSGAASEKIKSAEGKKLFIKDSMSCCEAAARAAQRIAKVSGMEGTVKEVEAAITASYGDADTFTGGWENKVWTKKERVSENRWTMNADGAEFKIKISAKINYCNIQEIVDGITLECSNTTTEEEFVEAFKEKLPGGYYVQNVIQYYKVDSFAQVKDITDGANEILVDGNIGAATAIIELIRSDGKLETVYTQQRIASKIVEYTFDSVSTEGDFTIENGVLVKYSGDAQKVVIPEGVTSLSETWLSGIEAKKEDYNGEDETIRCIVYPESLEGVIPAQPWLSMLEVVSFKGNKVTTLGKEAFYKAASLSYLDLPDGLKTIGEKALANGHRTRSKAIPLNIQLPDGLETIANYAFYWDDKSAKNDALQVVEEIVIPQSVATIGEYAFASPSVLGESKNPVRETFTITILNDELDYSEGMLAQAKSNKANIVVRAYSSSGVYKELKDNNNYTLFNLDNMLLSEAISRVIVKADDYAKTIRPADIEPEEVSAELIKSYGNNTNFQFDWGNTWDTSTDGKRYGSLSITDSEYTVNVKISLDVPPIYTLDDLVEAVENIIADSEFDNSNTENSFKAYIEERIPGKYKVKISDYNMQRAMDGAREGKEILVSGASGSVAAIVKITDYYGNEKEILVEAIVKPRLENYNFESVSKKSDFILSDDGTVLLEYYGTAEKLVVPDGVVRIANNWMWKNPANIKALVLPESLNVIPDNMCDGMFSLEVVSMKDNVIRVGSGAFAYCYSLKYIHLSENIEEISDSMFRNTYSLMDLRIPETAKKIGTNAFLNSSLRNITIPQVVQQVGENAFSNILKKATDIGGNNFTVEESVRKKVINWVAENDVSEVPTVINFLGKDVAFAISDTTKAKMKDNPNYKPAYFASTEGFSPKYIIRAYAESEAYLEGMRLEAQSTELWETQAIDMSVVESVARANTAARSMTLYNGTNEKEVVSYITNAFISANISDSVKWIEGLNIKEATNEGKKGNANGILELGTVDGAYSFRVELNNITVSFARPEIADVMDDFWNDDFWDDDFSDDFEDDFSDDFNDEFSDEFEDEEIYEQDTGASEETDGNASENESLDEANNNKEKTTKENEFPWIWMIVGTVTALIISGGIILVVGLKKRNKREDK